MFYRVWSAFVNYIRAMEPLFTATRFVRYRLTAKTAHGVHSPFVFELLNNVIRDRTPFYAFRPIESIRSKLLMDNTLLEVTDYGSGAQSGNKRRKVSDIALHYLLPAKYGQLLFRIVNRFQPKNILELGTSLGISSLYLSAPHRTSTVHTIEGCPQTAALATANFQRFKARNIEQRVGEFSTVLPELLGTIKHVDLAYLDGNHQYRPTLDYFETLLPFCNENTVLIFDDIHWSRGMENAWEEIKKHPDVRLTIDLFKMGFVFFRKEGPPQHFTLLY
jgi:predicted O-methyltransferase YrrM